MNRSITQTKPPPPRKSTAAPPVVTPLVLPGALAMFGLTRTKVRFPDRATATRGFRVLYRSGWGVEALGRYTFGCGSPQQVELLKQAGVRYEVVP